VTSLVGAVAILTFAIAFHLLKIVHIAIEVRNTAQNSTRIIADKNLDDDEKEHEVQNGAKRMAVLFVEITWRLTLALMLPIVGIWLLEQGGVANTQEVVTFLLRWDVIIAATVFVVLINIVRR